MKWQILTTPPCSGIENMHIDQSSMDLVAQGFFPRVRFFRFDPPTVSYGKHQSAEEIEPKIPGGWESVRRPTGGGVVFHKNDLCFSLCWKKGTRPIPESLCDVYKWIHTVVHSNISSHPPIIPSAYSPYKMASCHDAKTNEAFAVRDCFQNPVAFDLLDETNKKILGGALARQQDVFLYQGSLQLTGDEDLERQLSIAFQKALN